MRDMFKTLRITSPKRTKAAQTSWDGFFPYYAGFPESFARALISSADLSAGSIIHDPWNGSGTSTYAASMHGLSSIGFDLNPVMVIVAKARLLPASEADSIEPLGSKIVEKAKELFVTADSNEPLTMWFGKVNAGVLRSIEISIRNHLMGVLTHAEDHVNLDRLSSLAATNFVALFSVCRELATKFRSTNPTWLRYPRLDEAKPRFSNEAIYRRFLRTLRTMSEALQVRNEFRASEPAMSEIRVADTTITSLPNESLDFMLTSPPYCTRIDYTAATRVELAVLSPIMRIGIKELGRQMIGSTRVPLDPIDIAQVWGGTCARFMKKVHAHQSKASSGYYYRTHLDYFEKMNRSIANLAPSLKKGAAAIFVVQDSYYKDVYNDLPKTLTEMTENHQLKLRRRDDFRIARTMAGMHPYSRNYEKDFGAIEAVLCFEKI